MSVQDTLNSIEKQVNEDGFNGTLHISCEDYGVIKKALELQMPIKPNYEGDGYDENGELIYDTWICPCCNHKYEVDYDDGDHCKNCGQALNRSDEE